MYLGKVRIGWRSVAVALAAVGVLAVQPMRTRGQQIDAPVAPMSFDRAQALVDAATQGLDYVPGEAIVKFTPDISTAGQRRVLAALGDRPSTDRLEWIADGTAVLHDAGERDGHVLAEQLRGQQGVAYAEPNYIRRKNATTPNDPGYAARQWNFKLIDMPDAWDISPGGSPTVIVAVVDTGITTVNKTMTVATWNGTAVQNISVGFAINPDLSGSRLVLPMDFVTSYGAVVDTDGHGTHVSSTIGEDTNNNLADAGIAYKVQIMPVKVCMSYWDVQFAFSAGGGKGFVPPDSGGCPDSAIVQGIRYAVDNGARVINMSFGGEGQTSSELDALNYAIGKGAFLAAAGGNEKESGNPIEFPAANGPSLNGLMAVAAVNKDSGRAYYSNTGSYIEIAAPGGDDQDSDAQGSGFIWQSTLRPSVSDPASTIFPTFDQYAEVGYEGTSMATPHVSGLAALLMSQGIKDPGQIEAVIKKTAKFLGTPSTSDKTRSDEFGSGLIQPRTALFGFGVKK